MNGIEKITEKIISEARQKASEITENARVAALSISKDYAKKADAARRAIDSAAEAEAGAMIERAKASVETVQRNALLEKQAEIIDSVFEEAYTSIRSLPDDKYLSFLIHLASAALSEQVNTHEESLRLYGADEDEPEIESYDIILSKADRDRFADSLINELRRSVIGRIPPEVVDKVRVSENTSNIDGGLILRYGDIDSNCSLALMLKGIRESLEGQVSSILFSRAK